MPDPTNQVFHYNDPVGTTFFQPVLARLQATFAGAGAVTKDTTRRRSDPNVTITLGVAGTYAVAGLVSGDDGHILNAHLDPGTTTPTATDGQECQVTAYNPSAGTATLIFTAASTGAVANPPVGARLYLSILVETGAYT